MNRTTYALAETVSDLTALFVHQRQLPADSRELTRLVIEWAAAFEQAHRGESWVDREYLETVEAAFHCYYRAWLATAARSVS